VGVKGGERPVWRAGGRARGKKRSPYYAFGSHPAGPPSKWKARRGENGPPEASEDYGVVLKKEAENS